jgi:hypothetical protein
MIIHLLNYIAAEPCFTAEWHITMSLRNIESSILDRQIHWVTGLNLSLGLVLCVSCLRRLNHTADCRWQLYFTVNVDPASEFWRRLAVVWDADVSEGYAASLFRDRVCGYIRQHISIVTRC